MIFLSSTRDPDEVAETHGCIRFLKGSPAGRRIPPMGPAGELHVCVSTANAAMASFCAEKSGQLLPVQVAADKAKHVAADGRVCDLNVTWKILEVQISAGTLNNPLGAQYRSLCALFHAGHKRKQVFCAESPFCPDGHGVKNLFRRMVMSAPAGPMMLVVFVVIMVIRAGELRMATMVMAVVVTADRLRMLRMLRTGRLRMRMFMGMAAVVAVSAVRLTRMRRQNLAGGNLLPWFGKEAGMRIQFLHQSAGRCGLVRRKPRAAEKNDICVLNLIDEKLAEILQIHFAALCVRNGNSAFYLRQGLDLWVGTRRYNVGKLADP